MGFREQEPAYGNRLRLSCLQVFWMFGDHPLLGDFDFSDLAPAPLGHHVSCLGSRSEPGLDSLGTLGLTIALWLGVG